jgi:hypothetical protein
VRIYKLRITGQWTPARGIYIIGPLTTIATEEEKRIAESQGLRVKVIEWDDTTYMPWLSY